MFRIIPTRVGTRVFAYTNFLACEDHPHACGDKVRLSVTVSVEAGSSPRVWGQVDKKFDDLSAKRIIPTRVGTSSPVYSIEVF